MKIFIMTVFFWGFCFLQAEEMRGFLSSEEIVSFHRQGYFLKKQALTKDVVMQMQTLVNQAVEKACKEAKESFKATEEMRFFYIQESRIAVKAQGRGFSVCYINGCAGMEPELLEIIRSEQMVHTFFELLGTKDLEHLIAQIHPKLPGDQVDFPRHRDLDIRKRFDPNWQDILGNGSYAICILPVDPMTPENGGLWVDRGSYLGSEEELLWICAEPGDLLFMHPHITHGSGMNRSTQSRKTLLSGFCAFGANTRSYPGAQVNMLLHLREDGAILLKPAPWSQQRENEELLGH